MATATKSKIIAGNRIHEKDTGSSDVQIALLTERINHLSTHLQNAVKDFASRRGLLSMVSRRRRLLDYLHRTEPKRYHSLLQKLNLRK